MLKFARLLALPVLGLLPAGALAQTPPTFVPNAVLSAAQLNLGFGATLWRGNNLSDLANAATARANLGLAGTPTAGGLLYGTSTGQAYTAAGNSGNLMVSSGSAPPAWSSQSSLIGGTLSLGFATSLSPGYLNLQSSAGSNGSTTLASGATTSALKIILPAAAGTSGQVLTQIDAGTGGTMTTGWTSIVSSVSGGSTGLTPATSATGAVTLGGTLGVANGGTGVTSSTGSGSLVLATSPTFTTSLRVSNGTQGASLTAKSTTDAIGMPGLVLDTLASGQQLVLNPTGGPTKVSQLWNMEYPGNYYPTINLANANPTNQFLFGTAITGTYGSGVGALNRFWVNDSSDTTAQGDNPPVLSISYTKTGGKGFGEAMSLNCGLNTNITNGNFLTCFENRASPSGSAGGTSLTNPYGQNNAQNNYAILSPGATYWLNNSIAEENVAVMAGASSQIQTNRQYARLGIDWGDVGTTTDINAFAGRYGLWLTSQQPTYDGTSVDSATRSAGNNLPAYKSVFILGGSSQEFVGDSRTSLFSAFPQVFPNNNSCSAGVNNCPATTAAAAIRTQTLGSVMGLGNVHVANEAWRTPGVVIKGTGEIDVGNGSIAPSTQGLVIDAVGSYVSAATYVSGNQVGWQVGEYLYGSEENGTVPGAILRVAAVDGTGKPTSLTVVDPGYSSASAATNNASTTLGTAAQFMGHGTNTVSLTWTDAVESGGQPSVNIAPTNGHVLIGSGANKINFQNGTINAPQNISTSAGFVGKSWSIPNSGSNGGYGMIGNNGSNLVFKNFAGSLVAYYDMNAAAPGWVFNNGMVVGGTLTHGVVVDNAIVKVIPTSGTTVTVAQTTHTELLAPAGPLAALTLAFPACNSTYAGQEFRVSSTYAITTLTISISTGGNAGDWPASLTSGQGFAAICNPSDNGWYRLY